eukprot:s933_g2.t1
MQCLYQTPDLSPSATDCEIRSAYRRCALSTHPDKGGSAEAIRSAVYAFETPIDASKRAAYDYDRLRSCPSKSFAPESSRPSTAKRRAESPKSAPPVKVKRQPAKDAAEAPKEPMPPRKAPPAEVPEVERHGQVDHVRFFRGLLRMRKKQAFEELQKLREDALNAFAGFLQSEEIEQILQSLVLGMLALKDQRNIQKRSTVSAASRNQSGETKMHQIPEAHKTTKATKVSKAPKPPKAPKTSKAPKAPQQRGISDKAKPAHVARTLLKGVEKRGQELKYTPSVHDLDTAIQDWFTQRNLQELLEKVERAQLKSLHKQEQAQKRAARAERAVALAARRAARQDRLRQRAEKQEAKLKARQERRKAQSIARQRRDDQREVKFMARQKRQEMLQQKRLAFARVKHSRLRAMVLSLQLGFQKIRRQKLLKAWGVAELPEGPAQELQELRALQKLRGDRALQQEMQRRDVEAMTAFFVQSIRHNFLFAVKACLSGHCDPCAIGSTCVFKSWEMWGSCTEACEGGVEERKRGVMEGSASSHGAGCDGALVAVRSCNTQSCNQDWPVNCKWAKWGQWSACSKCAGQKTRSRRVARTVTTAQRTPECGGRRCEAGNAEEVAKCPRNCLGEPICEWSDWSAFSPCSVSCGCGRKKRTRRLQKVIHAPRELTAAYEKLVWLSERLDGHVQNLENQRWKVRILAFLAGPSLMLLAFVMLRLWSRRPQASDDPSLPDPERAGLVEMSIADTNSRHLNFDPL